MADMCVCVCVDTYIHIYTYAYTYIYMASLVTQMVKDLPAMWETQALAGQEEYIMQNARLDES